MSFHKKNIYKVYNGNNSTINEKKFLQDKKNTFCTIKLYVNVN